MVLDVVFLLVSLGLILLASVLFTNAVELFGHKLKMHQGAVGSILAAVGTALPETVIPIIAIVAGAVSADAAAKQDNMGVAIGAIAGAPFMLGTLAMLVTGVGVLIYAALGRRPRKMTIDPAILRRDLTYFVLIYGAAVLTTFIHDNTPVKVGIALALLASYGWYLRQTLKSEAQMGEEFEPLILSRLLRLPPTSVWITVQLLASLVLMVASADMFVHYVEATSRLLGVPALILSIIITPIATELPEKFNSVIWVGKKKDVLALGNITGAMVFQSCFPVVFGMIFTHWDLLDQHGTTMATAVLALASAMLMLAWVTIRKTINPYILTAGGLFYGAFVVFLAVTH